MAILYTTLALIILVYAATFFYFKSIEEGNKSKLAKVSFLRKILGILIRVLPLAMSIIHFSVLGCILFQIWEISKNPFCSVATHTNSWKMTVVSDLRKYATYSMFIYSFVWVPSEIILI